MHLNNPELTFELVFMSKTRNLLGRVNLVDWTQRAVHVWYLCCVITYLWGV